MLFLKKINECVKKSSCLLNSIHNKNRKRLMTCDNGSDKWQNYTGGQVLYRLINSGDQRVLPYITDKNWSRTFAFLNVNRPKI